MLRSQGKLNFVNFSVKVSQELGIRVLEFWECQKIDVPEIEVGCKT